MKAAGLGPAGIAAALGCSRMQVYRIRRAASDQKVRLPMNCFTSASAFALSNP
jgi:hypothetical protein